MKEKVRILSVVIVFLFICSMVPLAYAQEFENADLLSAESDCSENCIEKMLELETYGALLTTIPIQSINEQRSKYQLTEEELLLDTEELLELVLKSDYMRIANWEAWVLTSLSTPLEPRYTGFNGYVELISRDDFEAELVNYLMSASETTMRKECIELDVLKSICAGAEIKNKLSEETFNVISHTIYGAQAATTYASENTGTGEITYYQSGTVLTVGGQEVPVMEPTRELTSEEINQINSTYSWDGLMRAGEPTAVYNCHSYAWHAMTTQNSHWIEHVGIYVGDSATETVQSGEMQTGDIVVYCDENGKILHSAVVFDLAAEVPVMASKWGKAGVYYHAINNVPVTYAGSDGMIRYVVFRYHDYETTLTGNDYHQGAFHYYEYASVCSICNKTENNWWEKQVCGGPPCIDQMAWRIEEETEK